MNRRAALTVVAWEIALVRGLRKIAWTFAASLGLGLAFWAIRYRDVAYELVFRPDVIATQSTAARHGVVPFVLVAVGLAFCLAARVLYEARHGREDWQIHWELLGASSIALPILALPAIEFEHAIFSAALIVWFSACLSLVVARHAARLGSLPDLSRGQARAAVLFAYVLFVAVMGFLSYWRYITFHSEVCDASFETNSVAGIARHGFPTLSVAAYFYDGRPLPAPYFNNHVPLSEYLFVPFYLVYSRPSSILWAQAAVMGAGVFGAYLIGRNWLLSRYGGVLAAFLYVLTPSIQGFCLHDIHANIVVIPCMVLAVGLMEAGFVKAAFGFALLTAVCREEAPVYAIGLGLYWMFAGASTRRFRFGLVVVLLSGALEIFFSAYLMPAFGGQPRWDHFNLFFDGTPGGLSLISALLFNPLGAVFSSSSDIKLSYFVMSLVATGGLALRGFRAGFFLVPVALLLVPAGDPTFFALGLNYSAPLVPAAVLMGLAGIRSLWFDPSRIGALATRRLAVASYALCTALLANYLYGNIASKTYKFEYGQSPLRRENQRNYIDIIGYLDTLPPFGAAEKALWEVIDRVPKNVPILTSWTINPQLAHYDVSLAYGFSGGNPAPEERVRYVVIDKLPQMQVATEPDIARLRADQGRWKVFFENASGVIFERL